jgi:hypothetical protein
MVPEDARPRRTGAYQEKDLTGEYLFYDQGGGQVHVLNSSAREIYLLCDGSRTLLEIARSLPERFDVDEDTACRDAATGVADLIGKGLVVV